MAEKFTTRIQTTLNKVLPPTQTITGLMMRGDSYANEIVVALYKDGEKVMLSQDRAVHSVGAYIIMPDEQTTYTPSGVVNDQGEASVTLPSDIYTQTGTLKISIRLFADPATVSGGIGKNWRTQVVIASFKCQVQEFTTNSEVVPTGLIIPDGQTLAQYLDDINIRIGQINETEAEHAAAELAREQAEKGPNLDGQGGRVKAEADRVALYNQFNNMTVSAHRVNYYEDPEAILSIKQNPTRKHIEFGLVDGVGVSGAQLTNEHKLRITYTNGNEFVSPASLKGPRGETAFGMVVDAYDAQTEELTLNNTANNSHIFDDDSIPYEYIEELFRTL